jgi:hypothetical protein
MSEEMVTMRGNSSLHSMRKGGFSSAPSFPTLFLVLFTFALFSGHLQERLESSPSMAYESHGVLYLVTASGQTLQTVKATPNIGSFAISPDAKNVLFTPLQKNPALYGGRLYLMHISGTAPELLTRGPYYNKSSHPPEVYSGPDFSPDGTRAVFSIHSQPNGDLVEASGPFATLDIKTHKVTLLPSTLHVPGEAWGTGFASSAYWSLDGKRILLNFEDGFSLTDSEGSHLEDLSPLVKGDWASSLGWLGSQCIVYISGKDYVDAQKRPAQFLNLKTRESAALASLLDLNPQQVTGLVTISGAIRVRKTGSDLWVEYGARRWSIPNADGRTQVRILPRPDSETPESCR